LLRDSRSGRLVDISQIPFNAADAQIAQRQFTKWWEANQPGSPQVLMMEPDSEDMRVTGEDLNPRDLRIVPDELGRDSMQFGLKPDGARKMYNFTWEHQPDKGSGKYKMAIVLDDLVHNWPQLNSAIQSRGVIEGNFSRNEINELRINLQSGNIAVALNDNPISSQFIESDLGQELKEKGLFAIGISFLIVLVFMIFYYRFAGVVAALALLLNLLFILALIMAIQQPLTLTGLAGLVLTVGMSVDANVLIFERIREELDKGAALRMAIRNGFDKATTTIVDANVTTLITALVLYVIGTEQIKGFSVTLILGILMSMFTAIYCSRTVFDIWERKRWITRLSMIRMFGKTEINFINKRIVAGLLSVALIGVGIAAMFGLQDKILHHDLRGGSTVRVVFNEPPSEDPDQGRQIVKDALDAENIILNDEKIEFSVSKLQSEEFKDCVFKIDSNLPIFDGEGEPPYEELAPLISRVFEGKLELLSVKVSEPQVLNVSAEPAVSDTGWNWVNETTMVSAMTWSNPAVLLVANPQEDETDASSKVEAEATPAETPDDQNQETVEETVSTEEAPAETQDDNSFEPANETEADSDAGVLPEISTDLEFKFSISGKELTTLIVAAAQKADYEMTPEQVVLSSPDGNTSESFNSVSSKNWTVKLNLSNKDEANKILGAWSENYNELPYFPASSGVGGQIATDTQIQAMVAIFASLLGIIAYVWIRFQNVAFGLAAVVALIHDVLIVLGAIAVSHYVAGSLQIIGIEEFKISLPIVAALLTIIGYSLNDTIVVFDRIREVRGKRPELNADIVNTSISQTLSRTILTSLTTFIVVFILYWFGGDAIHGFAFSLVIGVIAGTYSSIFVASPVLLWLMNSVGLNPGDPISEAAAETT
ncbi:MAG: protein translocase subunit SecF, partial [Planctomycetota bacterium]